MGKAELAPVAAISRVGPNPPGKMVAFGTPENEETEEITWNKTVEYRRKIPQSPEESSIRDVV